MDLRARISVDRRSLLRVAQIALAAGGSWELALQLPGHGQPFFAPTATVIALGAERGRRGRQALQMMAGVALGILVGAAIVAAAGVGWWQLVVAVAGSLLLSGVVDTSQLVHNQAAASAVLVVALHGASGPNLAIQRLVDALIGGGVAILIAQILFPIDPVELVRSEARTLRTNLSSALAEAALALEERDIDRHRAAFELLDDVDDRRLHDALALARDVSRRAPRRRSARGWLEPLGGIAQELSGAVADTRAVLTAIKRIVDSGRAVSPHAIEAVQAAAAAVATNELEAVRRESRRAQEEIRQLRATDRSLGASVLAHAVGVVVEHAVRSVELRAEHDRRRLRGVSGSRSRGRTAASGASRRG